MCDRGIDARTRTAPNTDLYSSYVRTSDLCHTGMARARPVQYDQARTDVLLASLTRP